MNFLKIASDMKLGVKVGGSFAAVVALTGIVGGVGAYSVMTLSERMEIAKQSTSTIAQLQNLASKREDFLSTQDLQAADAAIVDISSLSEELGVLETRLKADSRAKIAVTEASSAVSDFRKAFEKVVGLTQTQSAKKAQLEAAVQNLEQAASQILGKSLMARDGVSQDETNARKTLVLANKVGQAAAGFQEEALTLQNLFNAAANNAKQLADIRERVAALAPSAKQMAANSFEGVDPGKFSQLAAKTTELEQTLDKLSQTKDYIEIFDLTDAGKAGFETIVASVKEIRSQANVAIDNVYTQADEINQRFYVVDSAADTVMQSEADANVVKASAFYFMLTPDETTK
ncbi:hypothetical protein, partial [Roseibium sp.]|uniref:hypothetical protein n=1 Tax=Roseibium sp. TaxID=1936156 RepID=UPI003D137D88